MTMCVGGGMGAAALFEALYVGAGFSRPTKRKDDMATEILAAELKGGAWLVAETAEVFSPERLSEDHRMIAATAHEFMTNEVIPAIDRLEQKDWTRARELIAKAGALGLIGTDVPEELGGVGLDKASSIIVGEAVGRSASFAATVGAETGLSIIPLLCFGTDAQKQAVRAAPCSGRNRRRVRAQRIGLRLRRTRRSDPRGEAARWIVHAERREDVDHQRRLRRRLHRLRQSRWRAFLRLHRRAQLPRCVERQGRAQDGAARLVDDAADPAGRRRCLPGTSWARSGRGTVSPSILSTTAGSSWRRCAQAARRWRSAKQRHTRRRAGSSTSRSRASAPSSTSSAR